MSRQRRHFGKIKQERSGRFQASYVGPDGARHLAPLTFERRTVAERWLAREETIIVDGKWSPPRTRGVAGQTFGEYAATWVEQRELKPRTRALYRSQLRLHLLPTFGDVPLAAIRTADVKAWHAAMDPSKPRARSQTYGLLRTILGTAHTDDLIAAQPCTMRGASQSNRKRPIVLVEPEQMDVIVATMPERLALWPVLAMWCALRFGEVAELRRKDIDVKRSRLHIARAVVEVKGVGAVVGTPKSRAGVRHVTIPPHILPRVVAHLDEHVAKHPDALLFPMHPGDDRHITTGWMGKMAWGKARAAAGRPDLRMHDLRHTGNTLFARVPGVTQADIKARAGHDSDKAAAMYLHAAASREAEMAGQMASVWR